MPCSPWSGAESLEGRRLLTAFWGLTDANELLRFRSEDLSAVSVPLRISGLAAGESIQSIDVRQRTGEVLGISSSGRLFSIDENTGAARLLLDLSSVWTDPAGLSITSTRRNDGDHKNDKVRIVSPTGENLRVDLSRELGVVGLENRAGFETNLRLSFGGTGDVFSRVPALVDVAYDDQGGVIYGLDVSRSLLVRQERTEQFYSLELQSTFVPVGPLGSSFERARLEVARGVRNPSGAQGDNVGYVLARDRSDSPDQLFVVSLSTGALTLLGQVGGGVSLRDFAFDSGSVLFAPPTAYSIDGQVSVPVHRSSAVGAARATIHIPVTTLGGLPSSMPGEVFFADGETTATLTFPAPTKSFLFVISPQENLERGTSVSVSLHPSDPSESPGVLLPSLFTRVQEPDDGQAARRVFEVSLSRPATQVVSLSLGVGEGGTATRGTDFDLSTPVLVTFVPGQITALVQVDVFGDRLVESSEYFEVVVNSISGAALRESARYPWSGRVGIENVNRPDVPVVTVDGPTWLMVTEPSAGGRADVEIWLSLNAPSNEPITLRIKSLSNSVGGATEGEDFVFPEADVVFEPGEVRKKFTLTLLGSSGDEGVEFTSIFLETQQARVDYAENYTSGITVQFAEHRLVPLATWVFSATGLPESTTASRSRVKVTARMLSFTGAIPPKAARVSVLLTEGPEGVVFEKSVVARNGMATFYSPVLMRAGRYEFLISASGVRSQSLVMQVVPGARHRLALAAPAIPITAGSPFNLSVIAVDRFGNEVGAHSATATVSLRGRRGVGLEGQSHAAFSGSKAVFSDLSVPARGLYTIEVREQGTSKLVRARLRVN